MNHIWVCMCGIRFIVRIGCARSGQCLQVFHGKAPTARRGLDVDQRRTQAVVGDIEAGARNNLGRRGN